MGIFSRKPKKAPHTLRREPPKSTSRSAVFSYYAKSSGDSSRSSRLRLPTEERRLKATETIRLHDKRDILLKNIPLLLALGIILIGIIYNTTLSANPQVIVNSVTDEQTFLRDKSVYQNALEEEFSRSWLSRSKITIDTQTIADNMTARFPELADVSVTLPLLGTRPVVQVEATRPALILTSASSAYVLDQRGIVLMDARELKNPDKLLPVVDESGLTIEKGKPALTAGQVAYILELQRQLVAKNIAIKEVVLPAEAQQVNVYLKDKKYYGKFLFLTDSRVAAGGFIALQKDLQKKGITPKEYIDARLEGRLYYK